MRTLFTVCLLLGFTACSSLEIRELRSEFGDVISEDFDIVNESNIRNFDLTPILKTIESRMKQNNEKSTRFEKITRIKIVSESKIEAWFMWSEIHPGIYTILQSKINEGEWIITNEEIFM